MEGKKSKTLGEKCQAVSEVYGQILMVVVTIILAASLVYPNIPESAPRANLLIEAHNFTQNETASAQNSTTPAQNPTTSGDYLIEASSGFGGNISPAGKIYVSAGSNEAFNIMPVDNYKVLDVLVDGNSVGPVLNYHFDNVSSSHSIQTSFAVDFDVINNNTVVPKGNFTVNATVLGCAFIREANVNGKKTMVPFPITCRLKLGNYTYDPWGDYTNASNGNINDDKNPRFWESPISFKADMNVTVEACSWEYVGSNNKHNNWNNQNNQNNQNNIPEKILEVNTSTNPSNLKVLTNGDAVPNIPGFQGQDSIEDFVTDYIENGSIKLKENEAIYLFELGNTNPNSDGADFQDLVILISVNEADTPQAAVGSQEADSSETSNSTPNEASGGSSYETPNEIVLKLVIEHCGGDTIDFKSPEETRVILQKGDDQRYLNFTELGVFKSGDRATLTPKEYGTNEQLNFSQGDRLSIKIVDVQSKSLIYSGSIMVK